MEETVHFSFAGSLHNSSIVIGCTRSFLRNYLLQPIIILLSCRRDQNWNPEQNSKMNSYTKIKIWKIKSEIQANRSKQIDPRKRPKQETQSRSSIQKFNRENPIEKFNREVQSRKSNREVQSRSSIEKIQSRSSIEKFNRENPITNYFPAGGIKIEIQNGIQIYIQINIETDLDIKNR